MQRTPRRPSASMAVALFALFCALAGTAVAQSGIIISTPDQLGPAVVTAPKIAVDAVSSSRILDRTITQADERNPSLRAKVRKDGVVLAGDVPGNTQHVSGSNRYDIVFSSSDLGPLGLDVCGISASPWLDFDQSSGHGALRAYVNHASGSAQFQVFTFELGSDGIEHPTEANFDVVAAC